MMIDIDDVEMALGSQDISLRIALAEAEVEISLLKAELAQALARLNVHERHVSEAAPESGMVVSTSRSTAAPCVKPRGKVFQPAH